ncbi:MAG TPA: alpha/beta hydrolase [Rudaea sp.]|nr:alpha/beta hydrolase [Rudaea sp.]
MTHVRLLALVLLLIGMHAHAADAVYGGELQGFDYPYPVAHYGFTSQGVALDMAYMDVAAYRADAKTVVLLHGKNFCAASWEHTIHALHNAGYRVVAPDQIGFCKSTKPERYQFTFQQLAGNTHALLASLGIDKAIVIGHSTGGMLATRYALMYPQSVEQLVLVSPIGLEDWKAKGVPWHSLDQWYEHERKTTADSVREYERKTYYAGQWKPEFDKWVQMYAGMFAGPDRDRVAWNSAALYDMIYTQPVVYEFGDLRVPTLLISGDKDTTAIGKDFAPPDVQAKLGHYDTLAREAAAKIPQCQLVTFADLGHASWMQEPDRFHHELLQRLVK